MTKINWLALSEVYIYIYIYMHFVTSFFAMYYFLSFIPFFFSYFLTFSDIKDENSHDAEMQSKSCKTKQMSNYFK